MIELLELSQVLKAVERTGTEVRYYDKECDAKKSSGGSKSSGGGSGGSGEDGDGGDKE